MKVLIKQFKKNGKMPETTPRTQRKSKSAISSILAKGGSHEHISFNWATLVVFGQIGCIWEKLVVFGKLDVVGQNWMQLGKLVVIGKSWLYSGQLVLFGQNWLYWKYWL